ncbi:MAG: MotA/TolQ/ExbB proton channel family protein [Elusimicrobiota bacterium]|nr:MotA/TolQ/ExbB proton channel family protein [Elusimicrobiota bacterium]
MNHLGLVKAFAMTGGDWVIHLLVVASVVALGVIIERAVVYRARRLSPALPEGFLQEWRAGDRGRALSLLASSPVERGLAEALSNAQAAGESVEQALEASLALERRTLENRLTLLNTLGNNAPFIGLLGTVLGVVRAFHDLAFASGAGPEAVMQGLSEALVATAVGIIVALPCVIAYNVLFKAADDRIADAQIVGRRLASALARGA